MTMTNRLWYVQGVVVVSGMADTQRRRPAEGIKGLLAEKGPSAGQVVAVAALFPLGGILLTLSGVTLTGTLVGLAVVTPLFVIFSPVIVPAALAIGLALLGLLASGFFGLAALSSLSYVLSCVKNVRTRVPEQMEYAKRRVQETASQIGQRTREMGQAGGQS